LAQNLPEVAERYSFARYLPARFMLIDPDALEAGFTAWTGSLVAGFEREGVAIDGKTLRPSFDHGREQSPLHLVSAWASAQGLVPGQRCVDGKSNEITPFRRYWTNSPCRTAS
jgi:hypothetical protein